MLQNVDITGGQVSGVDSLSSAASSVRNWQVDEAGINRVRPALVSQTVSGLDSDPIIGSEKWRDKTMHVTQVTATGVKKLWYVLDSVPATAHALSSSTSTTQVPGTYTNRRPTWASGTDYIYVTAGDQIQRWGPPLAGLSEVLSSSPRCTHIASIGQRLVANDLEQPHSIRWSDIGESTWGTWPAANATNADARPDEIRAIYENTNELFVWGETTLQTYQVGADPTLPFDQVSTINTGIGARYSPVRLDENFTFLDNQIRIVLSDGRTVKELSQAIAKDLRGLSTVTDAWGFRYEQGQHSLLVYRFPTAARTFVYDMRGEKWSEYDYYSSPFSVDWPVASYTYRQSDGAHIVGSTSSGLMKLDSTVRSDLSGALVCDRVTGWQDFGTSHLKRSLLVRLTMRRGTAAQGATAGVLELRVQSDNTPWSPWYTVSVGNPHEYEHVQDLYLGGIFRRRRYQLRYSNSDDVSLVKVEDDVEDLEAMQGAA